MPSEFKPHKSQTIKSDERGVRLLQNHIDELDGIANLCMHERILMAKLAETRPAFYYPLEAVAAKKLCDDILRVSCRLNPHGTRIR